MTKKLAPSRECAAKTMYATLQILKRGGGSLPGKEVINRIEKEVEFTDWEKYWFEELGTNRWQRILSFFIINLIKSGFLLKQNGIWTLTDEGEKVTNLSPYELHEISHDGYIKWSLQNKKEPKLKAGKRENGNHKNLKLMEGNNKEVIDEITLDNEKDNDEQDDLSGERKIYTEQGDPEIDSLHRRFLKGKLNVQPSFQRQFVWDEVKSSRLIESALLDIPIPIVYLSEEDDGKENVIDGQQRLTSFFSFIDGKFKLKKLNVFTELNGRKFNELKEELQDKITTYKIRVIKFKKESDGDLQFEIFARLNLGSVPLNDQELRNCVYRGKFNEVLTELSQDKDFKYLLGIATPDKRMKDRELVLRFASFYFNTYLNYNAPIKKFLNDSMVKYREINPVDELNLRNAFKNTVQIIKSLLDNNAFKRFYRGDEKNKNGKWETRKFNVSLFDILMSSFAREDKNTVFQNLDRIREAFIDLMTQDQDFIDAIELSTSSKKAVTTRFDKWRLTLQTILGIGKKEPRCFTLQIKQELFNRNNTCALCENKILNIDDAAVDHIKQYWTGGKTIPDNARLTHRYCNNARPRNE